MNRRSFSKEMIKVIGSYTVLSSIANHQLFANNIAPITDHWLKSLHEMSGDLKVGGITPSNWQEQLSNLYAKVTLEEIISLIDFDNLIKAFNYPHRGVNTKKVTFPTLTDLPKKTAFYGKLFGMKKNRAVIPHGHVNMASCHYVINGEIALKQYQKIDESDNEMIITKTVDELGLPGSYSSISDEENNVHWLRATTEYAHTFDVIVLDVAGKPYDINNIDPRSAVRETDGNMRVRKISVEEGLNKYGYDNHH